MLTLQSYLTLGAIIFSIGVIGIVINRKNIILIMMCTELLLIAVNFNFIAFSYFNQDLAGQIFVFFILTVAAAEAAIGLAILIALYRNKRTIDVEELKSLRN